MAEFAEGFSFYLPYTFAGNTELFAHFFQSPASAVFKSEPELQNPFEIRPAIGFALLFILLSVVTGFVKTTMGNSGLLGLASIVGVSDITPFILSIVQGSDGTMHIFTSAIILALMSNTVAKGIYFISLSPNTRKEASLKFAIYALLHIPFILW